jgi:phosphatidate cytidylyltransferase
VLKYRIITAIILIPLVISAILFLNHGYFAAMLAIILLIGAWEWAAIAGWQNTAQRIAFAALTGLVLAGLTYLIHHSERTLMLSLAVVLLWWALDIIWVVLANVFGVDRVALTQSAAPQVLKLLVGWLVLCGLFVALIGLRQSEHYGPFYVLFLLILIWAADSGAYFVGRKWGRHKLAVNISPGKSWEGVAGAVVGTLIVSIGAGLYWGFGPGEQISLLLVCLITVAFSILGDLTESLFKRQAHIKDSGHILPGHGGMLDRIDSLTAAAPVFLAGLILAGLP